MGTTNIELMAAAKRLKLKLFKGVFMRNELKKSLKNECGILNLDSSKNEGTHWVCWIKNEDEKYYFDSFGIQPPTEIIKYLKSPIMYNTYQIQQYNDSNCGEWCLHVLNEYYNHGKEFIDIVLDIVNNNKL